MARGSGECGNIGSAAGARGASYTWELMRPRKRLSRWSSPGATSTTASRCPLYSTRFPILLGKCQAMGLMTRRPVTRRFFSARPRQLSPPAAQRDWAPRKIQQDGVPRAIVLSSKLQHTGARRGDQWVHTTEYRGEYDV